MTFVIQSKRPVRRCRRGKSGNGGCAINFGNLGIHCPINFHLNSILSLRDKNSIFIACLILLLIGICFALFQYPVSFIEPTGFDFGIDLFAPFFFCSVSPRPPQITKKALLRIQEFHHKKAKNHKIRLRQIDRFFAKHERNWKQLLELRRENKILKDSNRRIKKENRKLKKKYLLYLLRKKIMSFVPLIKQAIFFILFIPITALIYSYLHLKNTFQRN